MLEALYEEGICPDPLVGTSAGAINASSAASRPTTLRTARELQRIWSGINRCRVFPANPLTAGLGVLGLREHTVSAGSLRRMILRHLQIERLEDAPVELHVVADDALSGEEVLLSGRPRAGRGPSERSDPTDVPGRGPGAGDSRP
jgi:NTE family protein